MSPIDVRSPFKDFLVYTKPALTPLIVPETSYWSLFLLGLSMLSTASFSSKQPDFAGLGTLNPPVVCVIRIPHIYLKDVITFVLHANWLLLPLSLHLELVFYQSHTFRLQPFSELLLFFSCSMHIFLYLPSNVSPSCVYAYDLRARSRKQPLY